MPVPNCYVAVTAVAGAELLPGGGVVPEGVVEGAQRLDRVEVPHGDGFSDVGLLERQDALDVLGEEVAVELEVLRVIPEPSVASMVKVT